MAKKVVKRRKKSRSPQGPKLPNLGLFYLRNVVVALSVALAFMWLLDRPEAVETNPKAKQAYQATTRYWYLGGFHSLWHDITGRKIERIFKVREKYPNLSIPDRYASKFGKDFRLIQNIVAKTPKDAQIYLPPEEGWPAQFKHIPGKRAAWLSFFFYPRGAHLAKSMSAPPTKEMTHILLTPKWGAQFIDQQLTLEQRQGIRIAKLPSK